MKLFLASSFVSTVKLFKTKIGKTKGKEVVFIANASDMDKGVKWWVDIDRKAFTDMGCLVTDTDLRIITKTEFKKLLGKSDVIHFCGGSTMHLISLIKDRGFAKIITDSIRKGKIVLTGSSAGSMIVAEDLSIEAHDADEKEFVGKIKDPKGLGLTNFLIMPHSNNKGFADGYVDLVKNLPKYSQALIFLYDDQAVWVEDGKIEIVSQD